MVRPGRAGRRAIGRVASAGLALALVLAAALALAVPVAGQEGADGSLRVVHGVSDFGPIDVYIDGRLAVVDAAFPSATVPLDLPAGNHRLAIAASGAGLETPLVESALAVEPGTSAEIALLGSAADMPAVLFPVDGSSLDADRARLRVVHGSPDAGPLDAAFVGGDPIFPTVEYLSASDYAEVPVGVYALDLRTPGADLATVSLADLALGPGDVVDVYVVGQVTDATVQPLVVRSTVGVTPLVGRAATLREGTCANPGAVVATLGVVTEPRGATVGEGAGEPIANGFGSAPVAFDAVVASPHAIVLGSSEAEDAEIVGCGAVAGSLTDDGALAVPLAGPAGDAMGLAVVAPGVLDPTAIDVSIFVLPDATGGGEPTGTPTAGDAETTGEPDAEAVVEIAPATPAAGG